MNYSDQILESKIFNIIKQLIKNVAIAICIILGACLILVYVFGFRPYQVLTDSMTPVFGENDMVIVKSQKEYKVGDVLTFVQKGAFKKVTHRLVWIMEKDNGDTLYVCHGDANNYTAYNSDGTKNDDAKFDNWQDYTDHLATLTDEQIEDIGITVQLVKESQIEGKVVTHLENWGVYVNEIANHKLLLIGMIIAVWCVTETIQNEIDMKRVLRLI